MTSQDLRDLNLAAGHLVPSARLLLLVLGTFADRHGLAWPSRKTLMAHTGLKERHLRETLAMLMSEGFLQAVADGWKVLMPPNEGGATVPESGGTVPEGRRYSAGKTAARRRESGGAAPDCANNKRRTSKNHENELSHAGSNGIEKTATENPSTKGANSGEFSTPTLAEVQAYAKVQTSAISSEVALDFFDKNEAVGWIDPASRPIRDWRANFRHYARCRERIQSRIASTPRNGQRGPVRPPTGGGVDAELRWHGPNWP